jgi:hypothetical protein
MPDSPKTGLLARRRAARRCRILDQQALREEFQLERPRGLAARLKAYAASVEDLERARVHARLWASRPRAVPADPEPSSRAPKALDPRA